MRTQAFALRGAALFAAAVAVAGGCDAARPPVAPGGAAGGEFPFECHACHGSQASPAPPVALHGKTDPTWRGVGAHATHVVGTGLSKPVACAACHKVPEGIWDAGHIDSPSQRATVTFSGQALARDATPLWDDANLTCSNVACHGAGLKGKGKHDTPVWTLVNGAQRACGSCHGAPPAAPHPQTGDCVGCHAATAGPNRTIAFPDKHIDGAIQVVLSAQAPCGSCHGDPPQEKNHPQIKNCQGCHADTAGPNGTIANAANHRNGKVEVALSANPPCAGCHGDPPKAKGHPQVQACDGCHATSVGGSKVILAGGSHGNGKVDVALAPNAPCAGCHGDPPVTKGHPQVVACDGCHATSVGANKVVLAGGVHRNGKVEVELSPSAPCGACHGAPPVTKDHPPSQACDGCHSTVAGPNQSIIDKTLHRNGKVEVVLGASAPCAACHGAPPTTKGHPQSALCEGCHSTVAAPNQTILDAKLHRNGQVETVLGPSAPCGACHGAPPTANKHPQDGACETCHAATAGPGPTIANAANHRNGKVEVKVAATANCVLCHGKPPEGKHPKQVTCQLCHAETVGADGKLIADGSHGDGKVQFALATSKCDTCHGAPPQTATHPKMQACSKCHAATVDDQGALIAKGGHVNGTVDVALPTACDACHGKNGIGAPPPDVNGNSDPTLPSVGAHAAHIYGKAFSGGGMACTACHVLPTTVDAPGHLAGALDSVQFPDGQAAWKGSVPTYDKSTQTCSNVYCHGAALEGGDKKAPVWTQPLVACTSCHAAVPSGLVGHPAVDTAAGPATCAKCHAKTIKPDGSLDLQGGYHINGVVNL